MARLRAAGRTVIGIDRSASAGILACDLADPAAIAATVRELPAEIGGLANVAGVPGTAPARTVLSVNVLGPILLTNALLPRLRAGSAIVDVASVAAHRNTQPPEAVEELIAVQTSAELDSWLDRHPLDGAAAYDTSKRVVVDWTQRLAGALAGTGLRALSVSPGPVETPILGDFATSMGQDSMDRSAAAVGRHGRPDEIAAVIAFALSPDASWLNGIDLLVEGGLMAVRAAAAAPPLPLPPLGPDRTDADPTGGDPS
jgi:NAD(P)-dependent dehydrogenase (short-subunit alcohol dehydrogenase family)